MKKTIHLLGLAAALVALAACEREPAPQNPTYNSEANTVNVEFVLNVSTGTGKDTKTTPKYAQVGGSFLGMDQVHMLAYQLDASNLGKGAAASQGHFFYNPWVGTGDAAHAVAATRDFSLGALFNADEIDANNSSRVVELALPLGTNAVAFYGKATKTADKDYQGSAEASGDPSDLSTLKFTLESRMSSQDRFDVGAFFFSSMLTYFIVSGLVDEATFWHYPSGNQNRSYAFWYPVPSESVAEQLPASPKDQDVAVIDGVTYTFYTGQLSWKQLGTMYYYSITTDSPDPDKQYKTAGGGTNPAVYYTLKPLGQSLGLAYYSIVSVVKSGSYSELRAGSTASILRVCEDLYSIVEKAVQSTPTSWEEHCALLLAQQIKDRMERYFKRHTDGFNFIRDANGGVDLTKLTAAAENSSSQSQWTAIKTKFQKEFGVDYFYNVSAGYFGFPQNVGLPYGAAIMQCSPNWADQQDMDDFSYTQNIPAYGMGDATFPIQNYRFPPELMYYGNSSLRVSEKEKKAKDFPDAASLWGETDSWDSTWALNGAVDSKTRSVAMKNTINYGTALLKSTVRYADGVTALLDNNAALHPGEQDNSIPVTGSSGGFMVTGIVVGGQADVMGWDFTRYPDSGNYTAMGWDAENQCYTGLTFAKNPFNKMIYDRVVDGYKIGQNTDPIYTMVWDNYDATKKATEQSDVYIAIELYNQTGQDFWGELNMVRKNGIFYLVGKLSLSAAIASARAKSEDAFKNLSRKDYNYPPYNPLTGETVNAPRVFMQDYVTEATLLLNADALKHAYVTVPDLRTSQVSLGLSIDLTWQPGLGFVVNMGTLE
ncbi:MAG: hypothetical protein IKZ60_01315 [Bacteroidales bacterium]|nr:hypothetical protein [Bacteroidales bacterium]